jgi:endonuclease YncB( thermonuclease family)
MRDETKTFRRDIAHELVEQGIAIYVNPKKKQEKSQKRSKKRNLRKRKNSRLLPLTKC